VKLIKYSAIPEMQRFTPGRALQEKTYRIDAVVETTINMKQIDMLVDPMALYLMLTSNLASNVLQGKFTSILQSEASIANAQSLKSARAVSVSSQDPIITRGQKTNNIDQQSSSTTESLSDGAKAGIAIAALVAVVAAFSVGLVVYRRSTSKNGAFTAWQNKYASDADDHTRFNAGFSPSHFNDQSPQVAPITISADSGSSTTPLHRDRDMLFSSKFENEERGSIRSL